MQSYTVADSVCSLRAGMETTVGTLGKRVVCMCNRGELRSCGELNGEASLTCS